MQNARAGRLALCCLIAAFWVAGIGLLLNRQYYRTFGPFFDSMSYDDQLAGVIALARGHGILAAIGSTRGSTVALPWIPAAMLARWIRPSREFGVYFNGTLLLICLACVSAYPRIVAGWTIRWVGLGILAFASLHCLYRPGGGLQDFRMDLGFFLLYTATVCTILIARQMLQWRWWLLGGALAGITCLDRATAPLYLLVALGPMVVIDFWRGPLLKRGWWQMTAALLICVAIAGWMYAARWAELKWYYLVWNRHANANAPMLAAFAWHFRKMLDDIGLPAGISLCIIFAFGPRANPRRRHETAELLYLALAPVVLLAMQGAGHNPFVSMPAVCGIFLFVTRAGGGAACNAHVARSIRRIRVNRDRASHGRCDGAGRYRKRRRAGRRQSHGRAAGCG